MTHPTPSYTKEAKIRYKQKHPERYLELKRAEATRWRGRKTKEELYDWNRRASLFKNYGITHEQYKSLNKLQRGRCAICGRKPKTGRPLCVDHDHKTLVVRGLLCDLCNSFIGTVDKRIGTLTNAIDYIKKGDIVMPVHTTTKGGRPAYQWGNLGAKYPYTPGNKASRERAKKKAINQGLAVAYRTGTKPEL